MRFLYFLLLLFFAGCKETPLDFDIPYQGDKLVLWGQLDAGAPLRIQVTRSFNPVGVVPEDVTVTDARVEVVVNGKDHLALVPSAYEKGMYTSDHLVLAGATYVVKVSAQAYPVAESKPVEVPAALPDVTVERIRDVAGEINHQTIQDLVSVYFPGQQDAERYYGVRFVAYYEKDTLSGYPYGAMDNVPAKESDCHTWGLGKKLATIYDERLDRMFDRYASTFLLKSKCLPAPEVPVKFYIEPTKGDPIRNLERAYKVTLEIVVVTREAFDYAKIEYDQPEGLDLLILPPQRALSNVENGYGLIFASNEKVIEIP